jgi:hypothetical protein
MSAAGHEPPRRIGGVVAAVPPIAAATLRDRRGGDGPHHDRMHRSKERLHSITRSARSKVASGIVMPIFLAVFRFKISSNFVGCSIGKAGGVAPLASLAHIVGGALEQDRYAGAV